jgi:glycosyltransferase involved in cell wall biosynthesis
MPDYSIIVPAYNEEDLLRGTLGSIAVAMARAHGFEGEVIVVDNNSTDDSAELAEGLGARIVFEQHRQIARARNAGAEAARGRYFIFLDADTRLSSRLLRLALSALHSGRVCGGGAVVAFDRPLPLSAAAMRQFWMTASGLFRWAAGSFIFCRRDAFEAVGGFDERLYASEEIRLSRALAKWALRHGYATKILDEPAVTSARKLQWVGTGRLLAYMAGLGLNPRRLRSRRGCRFWYDRPGGV